MIIETMRSEEIFPHGLIGATAAVAPSCNGTAAAARSALSRMGWKPVIIGEICENAYCILRRRET
jgi:hypothetical protein